MKDLKQTASTLGNPHADEMLRLGKSVLASQIKQELDNEGVGTEIRIEQVRGLVERVICGTLDDFVQPIDKLAQLPLAYQVKDVRRDEKMPDEEKVSHIRGLAEYFIVSTKELAE